MLTKHGIDLVSLLYAKQVSNGSYGKDIFCVWLIESNSLQANISKLHIIALKLLVPALVKPFLHELEPLPVAIPPYFAKFVPLSLVLHPGC